MPSIELVVPVYVNIEIIVNMDATPEQKNNFKDSKNVQQLLLQYNDKLQSVSGRLLVRPSGTENLIRITVWGDSEKEITAAKELNGDIISLGKRILRTETAAITAVSMCMLYSEMNLE